MNCHFGVTSAIPKNEEKFIQDFLNKWVKNKIKVIYVDNRTKNTIGKNIKLRMIQKNYKREIVVF